MVRQLAKYGAALIGLYLVVAYGSGFGQSFGAVANGVSGVTRTLQGRG